MSVTVTHEALHRGTDRWWVRLSDGRSMYRYRWLMEQALGRPLATGEHVHHIDGDHTNDVIDNLTVMSASEHGTHHNADRLRGTKAKWLYEWSASHAACVECGTTERKHTGHGQCSRCYFRNLNRAKRGHEPRKPATFLTIVCEGCGESFVRSLSQNAAIRRYCSMSCASRAKSNARWARERAKKALAAAA